MIATAIPTTIAGMLRRRMVLTDVRCGLASLVIAGVGSTGRYGNTAIASRVPMVQSGNEPHSCYHIDSEQQEASHAPSNSRLRLDAHRSRLDRRAVGIARRRTPHRLRGGQRVEGAVGTDDTPRPVRRSAGA